MVRVERGGVGGGQRVEGTLVKVSEVKPGKMCMKCVADVRHVLLCDDACEMVYAEGGDERESKWRVEKEGVCERDEMAMGVVQRRSE